MPFSKGHRPPRGGGGLGTPDVGVVELVFPVDVEPEVVDPVRGSPVIELAGRVLAVDGVEVDGPLEALEAELELTVVALEEVLRGVLEVEAEELMEITGRLEETAVPKFKLEVEEDRIVAVLLEDSETLVAIPLEAGAVALD